MLTRDLVLNVELYLGKIGYVSCSSKHYYKIVWLSSTPLWGNLKTFFEAATFRMFYEFKACNII